MKLKKNPLFLALMTIGVMASPYMMVANAKSEITEFNYDGNNLPLEANTNILLLRDSNGQFIDKDSHLTVDFDPSNTTFPKVSNIYGGYANLEGTQDNATVSNVSITFKNGKVTDNVRAAVIKIMGNVADSLTATASGHLIMEDGIVGSQLIGAYIHKGVHSEKQRNVSLTAKGSVVMNGGQANVISGATILDSGNSTDYAKVEGSVVMNAGNATTFMYGGYISGVNNFHIDGSIDFNGGEVNSSIFGAYSSGGNDANANGRVTINSGLLKGNIYGAHLFQISKTAQATSDVVITGGVIEGTIASSVALLLLGKAELLTGEEFAKSSGNLLLEGGDINGKLIYLARAGNSFEDENINFAYGSFSATDSYLKVSENVNLNNEALKVWGGMIDGNVLEKNAFRNNILDFHGKPLTVSTLGNFEQYNFYLNDVNTHLVNTETGLVTVTESLHSEDTWEIDSETGEKIIKQNQPSILLKGISGESSVAVGDYIHLLSATDAKITMGDYKVLSGKQQEIGKLSDFFAAGKEHDLQVGLVRKIGVVYDFDDENNSVIAYFVDPEGGAGGGGQPSIDDELVDKNVKPLAEGRIAALMKITRQQRLEEPALRDLVKGSVTPFVKMQGGRDRYQSGSHITANTYDVLLGIGYRSESLSLVGFGAYGYDDYKTYNDSDEGRLKGKGHNKSFGIGISGLYDLNENLYASFGGKVGRIETKFDSQDVLTGSGENAHYKTKGTYFSGHLGLGYRHYIDNGSRIDSSIHYLHSRIGSDTVNIDGDDIHFKALTSSKLELKTRYERDMSEQSKFNVSLAYQYEFDGKGDANVAGVGINAPSMKGSTGIVGIGFEYQPTSEDPNSFINRSRINVNVEGYFGKRRGGNLSLTYRYMF